MLVYGQASNARLLGKQGYLTVDVLYKNHYGFLHIQEVLLDTVNPTTILRKIKIFLLSTPGDKNKAQSLVININSKYINKYKC